MNKILSFWEENKVNNIMVIDGFINTLEINLQELNQEYNLIRLFPKDFAIKQEQLKKNLHNLRNFNSFFNDKERLIIIYDSNEVNIKKIELMYSLFLNSKTKVIFLTQGISELISKTFKKGYNHYTVENNQDNIDKIIDMKNMIVDLKLKKYIIEKTNGDINKINEIVELIYEKDIKKYKYTDYKDILNNVINVENNTKLFEMIVTIFTNEQDAYQVNNNMLFEKKKLPLMVEFNYHSFINKNTKDLKESNETYKKISENISISELLNNFIFDERKEHLHDNISDLSCFYPSQLLNNKNNNKIKLEFSNLSSMDFTKKAKHINFYKLIRKTALTENNKDDIIIRIENMLIKLMSPNTEINNQGFKEMDDMNLSIDKIDQLIILTNNPSMIDFFSNTYKKNLKKLYKKYKG